MEYFINDERQAEIPYIELEIDERGRDGDSLSITFRKYPKHIFVAYCEDSGNVYGGDDNMDVYIPLVNIIEKSLHADFYLLEALKRVFKITDPIFAEEIACRYYEKLFLVWEMIILGDVDSARKLLPEF